MRCEGVIFEPERFKSKFASYHRKCFTCKSCAKPLDSSLSDVVVGPDNDIYCSKCNKILFDQSTAVAYSDPKSITAKDGKGCPRCKGLVFTAEQITEKGRTYHLGCFTCNKCKRPLTNRVITFQLFEYFIICLFSFRFSTMEVKFSARLVIPL